MYAASFIVGEPNQRRSFSKISLIGDDSLDEIRQFIGSALDVPFYSYNCVGFHNEKQGPVVCGLARDKKVVATHEDVHAAMSKLVPRRIFHGASMDFEEPLAYSIGCFPKKPGFVEPVKKNYVKFAAESAGFGDLQYCTPYWASTLRDQAHHPLIGRLVGLFGPERAFSLMVEPIKVLAETGDKQEGLNLIRSYLIDEGISEEEVDALDVGDFGTGLSIQGLYVKTLTYVDPKLEIDIFTDDPHLEDVVKVALADVGDCERIALM